MTGENVLFTPMLESYGDSPLTYQWNFGDGENSTEMYPIHVYNDEGEFEVILIVKDITGDESTLEEIITVNRVINNEISIYGYPIEWLYLFSICLIIYIWKKEKSKKEVK
jgi:PKD repeat protein